MKTRETQIPFGGFYESWAMDTIDSAIEQNEDYYPALQSDEASVDFKAFAKLHVEEYAKWLSDEEGIDMRIDFIELHSPRQYNFGTDKIFCQVNVADMWKLYKLFVEDLDRAQELINDRFKSRSGFSSFYDEFVSEWKFKPLGKWDANELSILFPEPEDGWLHFYDDANSNGAVSECIQYPQDD
tara:strand:- start:484 stop:1035 length:552 start_codon:yes stop_codon:yes gene_type:complete